MINDKAGGTIYQWALGWYCRTGNYAATAEALIQAGAELPDEAAGTDWEDSLPPYAIASSQLLVTR